MNKQYSDYLHTNPQLAEAHAKWWVWASKHGKTYTAESLWHLHEPERENFNPESNPYRAALEYPISSLAPDNITPKQLMKYMLEFLKARMELDPEYAAAVLLDMYDRSPELLDEETTQFIEAHTYINENWKAHPWSDPQPRREFIDL